MTQGVAVTAGAPTCFFVPKHSVLVQNDPLLGPLRMENLSFKLLISGVIIGHRAPNFMHFYKGIPLKYNRFALFDPPKKK